MKYEGSFRWYLGGVFFMISLLLMCSKDEINVLNKGFREMVGKLKTRNPMKDT